MADDKTERLGYSIPAITAEDDAGAAYAASYQNAERVDLDTFMEGMLPVSEAENDPASPAGGTQDGQEPVSGADAPQNADVAPDGPNMNAANEMAMSVLQGAVAVGKDVFRGGTEIVPQVAGGVVDAVGEIDTLLTELMPGFPAVQIFDPETGDFSLDVISSEQYLADKEEFSNDLISRLTPHEPASMTGGFIRSTTQFLVGFLPATKVVKGLSAVRGLSVLGKSQIANAAVAGALADMVVFDPHEDRLSTFLNEIPVLGELVPEYLSDNDPANESAWEGRIKNAIEGLGIGIAAEGLGRGLLKAFKYYKAQRKLKVSARAETPDARQVAARDVLKDEAHQDIVQEVSDEALAPLGDPNGPLVVEAATDDETTVAAFKRLREASKRANLHQTQTDALAGIRKVVDGAQSSGGANAPKNSWFDVLDTLRSDQDIPKPANRADDVLDLNSGLDESLRDLGINVNEMSNEAIVARLRQIEDEAAQFARAGEGAPENAAPQDIADLADEAGVAADVVEGTTPLPTGKIFINHARISSGDDVRAVLQHVADQDAAAITAKSRGVVSNTQTIKESSTEFNDLTDLLGREPGPMSASEGFAARQVLASSADQIIDLAKIASSPAATKTDLFNFRRAMSVHYAIQSEVLAARTETARALQSWAIPAGASPGRSQAITDLITQNGGSSDLQKVAKAIIATADNPAGVGQVSRQLGMAKVGDALFQIWINGLLSSPKTHVVNITSNAMVAGYAIPERYMAAAISKVFYDGEIGFAEGTAKAFGLVKGARDAARLVVMGRKADGIGDLSDIFDAFGKIEGRHVNAISADVIGANPESVFGQGVDLLGQVVNLPGSMLEGEDKFFKAIGYRMELNALAYRDAAGEGLEGAAFAKRVEDILANPPEGLKADAIDAAFYQTFTKPLGDIGKSVQRVIKKTPLMRIAVPFVRTPANIMKYTLERTPLAYMSGRIRADIRAGGARAAQAHARVALGSIVMMTFADMTMEGTVSGGGPLDPRLRKAQMRTGWQPYSVKIAGRWWRYSRLDPIGMMMGLSADATEIVANASEEDGGRLVTAGIIALSNNLASKTYMSGVYDLIGALDPSNPTSDPSKYLARMTGTIVPYSSFLRSVTYANDPLLRETREGGDDAVGAYLDTLANNIKKGIPGMSDTLPLRRDLWGNEITRASGIGWTFDFLSPIASRVDDPDPVDQIIIDNKIPISMPQRVIEGAKLSNEEYSEFVSLAGEPAKAELDVLARSGVFKNLSEGPDGMAAEILLSVVNKHRRFAAERMQVLHPELRERIFRTKIQRQNALLGTL